MRAAPIQRYVAKRLLLFVPTLILASMLIFLAMRALPGDLTSAILGGEGEALRPEMVTAIRDELGLNDPLWLQYARWLWSMVNGEFGGRSMQTSEPIASIVARQLPVTLLLAAYTLTISVLISIPLGVIAAARPNRPLDYGVRMLSIAGSSAPSFWIALVALLFMVKWFRWSPPLVYSGLLDAPVEHLQMMFLPALVLGWGYGSHLTRVTRSQTLEAFQQDYVRTARAKGVGALAVTIRHALRTALIPIVTAAALNIGGLLSGAVVLENIFTLPGIGRGLVQAVIARDYPVVQSLATLCVLIVLTANLLVDLVYARLDPRVTYDE